MWYQVNPLDPSNNFCAPSRKSTHALKRLRWPLVYAGHVAAVRSGSPADDRRVDVRERLASVGRTAASP